MSTKAKHLTGHDRRVLLTIARCDSGITIGLASTHPREASKIEASVQRLRTLGFLTTPTSPIGKTKATTAGIEMANKLAAKVSA
jgi:hypothetical protein